MSRWALLSLLLFAATLGSAIDTALEAHSGVAVIQMKLRQQTEIRGAERSHYNNLMAWQIIRTLLLAGGFACSLKIWRTMRSA